MNDSSAEEKPSENGKYNPFLKPAMNLVKVFHKTVEDVFTFEEAEKPVPYY